MKARIPTPVIVFVFALAAGAFAQPINPGGLAKVVHSTAFTGDGNRSSSLDLTHACSTNQVLQWNGTAWACAANGGGLSGLTTNQIVKATSATTIGNAWPADDATTWGVASKFTITESSGNFRSFGTGQVDGNLTLGAGLILSQAADDYVYSSLASSSGNQGLNIAAAGNGKILFQSGHGGFTNAGTGGIELDAGGSSTTSVWSVTGAGVETLNGTATINGTANTTPLSVNNSSTGQTAAFNGAYVNLTGSMNTTAGAITDTAVAGSNTMTRSAGANNLTNVGLYGNASGAQINVALRTDNGDVQLNNLSGVTTVTGYGSSPGALQVSDAATATAGDVKVLSSTKTGSLNSTAATRNAYALYASSTATRSSGANDVINYGIYATASGAQQNYSIFTDAGDEVFNNTSGTALFDGDIQQLATKTLYTSTISANLNSDLYLQKNGTSTVHVGNGTADALTWNGTTATLPSATTFTATPVLTNGASGYNGYASKYLEWTEEWLDRLSVTSGVIGAYYTCAAAGTSAVATTSDPAGVAKRPGVQIASLGSTSTGRAACTVSLAAFQENSGDVYTFEEAWGIPTLSNGTDGFAIISGFFDTITAIDQTNGCYFLYDERGVASTPTTGSEPVSNTLACVCSAASVRTEYPIDGTTVSDESFTTVATTAAALAADWSSGVLHTKVVFTGGTRAEFYTCSGTTCTKVCDINSHLPTGTFGAGHSMIKSVGTTSRNMKFDFTGIYASIGTPRT